MRQVGQVLEVPRPNENSGRLKHLEIAISGNGLALVSESKVFRTEFPGVDRPGDQIGVVARESPEDLFASADRSIRQCCACQGEKRTINWSARGAPRMNRALAVHLVKSVSGTRDIPIQGGCQSRCTVEDNCRGTCPTKPTAC